MEELQVLTDNEVTSKPQQSGEDVKLTLSWEELSVWRTRKTNTSLWKASTQENVQILDRVSGSLQSGMLMAIMGPSGAGKTSLLASVSMREQGTQTGELLLNGAPVTRQQLAKLSGFVPQQDLAFETLTVVEHMEFMARLKMDRHTPESVRKKRINHLVHELSISKCFYTRLSGLSGGERRRLSLAVQLINDPPLLFCDEPTTGLDSWGAGAVVRQLVALSSAGKAVLCSIHQPASGIFDLFHHVLLLAGGRVAYRGPVSEAATFFAQQQLFCPIGYNEAEFLVSAVSSEERAKRVCGAWRTAQLMKTQETLLPSQRLAQNGDREAGRLGGILSLHDELEAADYLSDNPNRLLMKPPIKHSNDVNFDRYFNIEKPGVLVQFSWLMWRSFISAKRDNMIWFVEFLSLMGISLMLAFPFQNVLQTIDQHDIQNIQGLMYLIVTETIFMFIYAVFNKFPSEIAILLREVANGLYSPGPYYLSKILLMIPSAIVEPFIYSTIIFWIVGLKGGLYGFFLFIVPVIFAANCANAYGSWLSATFESIETATLVSVPIDLVSCALSGPFINLASLPAFIGWLKYGSIFFYSSEAISILQWERIEDVACIKDLPCIPTGSEVLKTYGFEQTHYIFDLYGMLLMYLGFHLLGFLALWRRSQKQPVY